MTKEVPYGASEPGCGYDAWLAGHELRYVPDANRCIHWISEGKCPHGVCGCNRNSWGWWDHVSAYTDREGNRFLICQPYNLSEKDCQQILEAAQTFDLHVQIDGRGWYGHGTVCIKFEPARQAKARLSEKQAG
jgi:hypothetical protein